MDYTTEIENVKSQLKQIGFDDEKLNQLMDLAAEEILQDTVDTLGETADDATLEMVAQEMEKQVTTQEEVIARINMIFEKAFGTEAENKKNEFLLNYLKQTLEDTTKAKDLYNRYQAGDPSAVATIKAQEGNPDVQKVVDMM